MKNIYTNLNNLSKMKLVKGPYTLDRNGASIPIMDSPNQLPYHVMNLKERNRRSAANSRENRILRFEDLEIETTYNSIIKDIVDAEFEAIKLENAAVKEDVKRMQTLRDELKTKIQLMKIKN